jgi:hypothetical protein
MLAGSGVVVYSIDSCPLFAVAIQLGELVVPVLRNPTIEEPFGKMKSPPNGLVLVSCKIGVGVVALGGGRVFVPRSATYT